MSFWLKDLTFVCPTEIAAFGARSSKFGKRGAVVYGISTDSGYVYLNWRLHNADLRDLPIPMLTNTRREFSATQSEWTNER